MFPFKKKEEYTFYEADEYYAENGYEEEPASEEERSLLFSTKVVLFIIAYIFFLAIGIFSTSFITDPVTGKREAQVVTVQLHEERKSYELLKEQYMILYELLKKTQEIDSEFFASGSSQPFAYATKYESLLPIIDRNIPRAKGLPVDSKYRTLQNQVVNLYVNDLSIYLQKMSTALAQRDETAFKEGLSWREKTILDYQQLKENMKVFARLVKIEDKDLEKPIPLVPLEKKPSS